jgi:hypothetical protein
VRILPTWRELQEKFHELHRSERPGSSPALYQGLVRLGLTLLREELLPPQFTFRDGPSSPYFKQNYIQIATDAGLLLGKIPEGVKPVEHWLDSLVTFCVAERKEYVQTVTELGDKSSSHQIQLLCEASATYCAWLDVQTIEAATLGTDGELHRAIVAAVSSVMGNESAEIAEQSRIPQDALATISSRMGAKTIGDRLDEIALLEDISHEEQADRIGISRSMYFEVKAGRGGR